MSVEIITKAKEETLSEESKSSEVPILLLLGEQGEEVQKLSEAGKQAGFLVHHQRPSESFPSREVLDPDLVVATSGWYAEHAASLPASFENRLVRMVAESDWSSVSDEETYVIASNAHSAELTYRLSESLKQIKKQAWQRLGLPVLGNQDALWEMIPSTDWVTGLDNRLRFLQVLHKNVSHAKRYERPFCCLLVRFDNYALFASDEKDRECINLILEEVAGVLEVSIRDVDFLARIQSDLFGILLPETDLENTQVVISRIKKNLKEFQFSRDFAMPPVFSCGVAPFDHESSADSLLQKALCALEAS